MITSGCSETATRLHSLWSHFFTPAALVRLLHKSENAHYQLAPATGQVFGSIIPAAAPA